VESVRIHQLIGCSETILDQALLEAVAATPRHLFVSTFLYQGEELIRPTHPRYLEIIYSNEVLVYERDGAALCSTSSEPGFILHLLQLLNIQPGDHVLEIGAGAGWLSALMGHLVGAQGTVLGIEIDAGLAHQAKHNLATLGRANVEVRAGDVRN